MFLVGESAQRRENKIRQWLINEPSIALIVSAVLFEWTICRAIFFLSKRPNIDIRKDLSKVYGLKNYKIFWNEELGGLPKKISLPKLIPNWKAITEAFEARNILVHGKDRYTRNMATPHVEALLKAVMEIENYCSSSTGLDFRSRLPIRKKIKKL